MKKTAQKKQVNVVTCFFLLVVMGLITACEKDVYDPNGGSKPLPPAEDYFDFNLTRDVQLTVNYASQDLKILFEVYDEYPLGTSGYSKKEGVTPIYAAYTDKNGKFNGKMNIPTALKEVYLCTDYYGFPKCVKVETTNNGANYTAKAAMGVTRADVTGYDWSKVDKYPYMIARFQENPFVREDNVYALYSWGNWGIISKDGQIYNTPNVSGSNETMDQFTRRIQKYIGSLTVAERRTKLLANREKTDIVIKEDGTALDVVFMGDAAQYANVFGYYYYTENEYYASDFSLKRKAKYVVFPNASYTDSQDGTQDTQLVLEKGTTVKLQYFGPDGTSAPSYEFPKNCIVGWFYGRNSFVRPGNSTMKDVPSNGIYDLSSINCYSSIDGYGTDLKKQRFIALKDVKTNILVLGFEDNQTLATDAAQADPGQEDYIDVLFYVKSNKDITEGKPEIPEPDPKPEEGECIDKGTLAFEDIWPVGGDYDLNDVIVEYERKFSFNADNKAIKVVETFKPVHPKESALQDNFFACQYQSPGIISSLPANVASEQATGSIVITASAKSISGNKYEITRDLANLNLDKDVVIQDFNPYIITGKYTTENRIEVHLPKYAMTSAADKSKMNAENAYFISKDRKSPFAIKIPITGFIPADETKMISSEGQYPSFKLWVESKGNSNADWYKKDKGAQK